MLEKTHVLSEKYQFLKVNGDELCLGIINTLFKSGSKRLISTIIAKQTLTPHLFIRRHPTDTRDYLVCCVDGRKHVVVDLRCGTEYVSLESIDDSCSQYRFSPATLTLAIVDPLQNVRLYDFSDPSKRLTALSPI